MSTEGINRRGFLSIVAASAAASCSKSPPDATASTSLTSGKPFPKRRLGRTNVMVSMLGVGGAHLGRTKDEAEAIRIVQTAIDHGIDFMDNSWDYNGGVSEERLGKALEGAWRDRAFVMTKLDGRTKDAATGQLEQSLKRLRTDRIDLVQIHEVIRMSDPDRVFGAGGAIEALALAQKAGKVRFIGFTGHKDPSIHLAMLKAADAHGFRFDTVQMPINVMDPHYKSFEKEVLPELQKRDIGALGMKSMGDKIILEAGVVTPRDCLRYALSAKVAVVITGIDSMDILKQAFDVGTTFEPLSDAERQAILAKTAPVAQAGKYERFKTSDYFDSTAHHPEWLERASM